MSQSDNVMFWIPQADGATVIGRWQVSFVCPSAFSCQLSRLSVNCRDRRSKNPVDYPFKKLVKSYFHIIYYNNLTSFYFDLKMKNQAQNWPKLWSIYNRYCILAIITSDFGMVPSMVRLFPSPLLWSRDPRKWPITEFVRRSTCACCFLQFGLKKFCNLSAMIMEAVIHGSRRRRGSNPCLIIS